MGRNDIHTLHVPIAPPLPPVEPPQPPALPADGTQAGPALALEQFLGAGARGAAGSVQIVSNEQPAGPAGDSSCPTCQAALSRVEQRMGRCLSCGKPLQAPSAGGVAEQRPGFTVGI